MKLRNCYQDILSSNINSCTYHRHAEHNNQFCVICTCTWDLVLKAFQTSSVWCFRTDTVSRCTWEQDNLRRQRPPAHLHCSPGGRNRHVAEFPIKVYSCGYLFALGVVRHYLALKRQSCQPLNKVFLNPINWKVSLVPSNTIPTAETGISSFFRALKRPSDSNYYHGNNVWTLFNSPEKMRENSALGTASFSIDGN